MQKNKLTKFQKYLLALFLVGLTSLVFVMLRQQEISRCRNFFAEQKAKLSGRIDWARDDPNYKGLYRWCDFVVYGFNRYK